jgi:hypothetical protein
MDKLHAVAEMLLEKETITGEEFRGIFEEGEMEKPVASVDQKEPEKDQKDSRGSHQGPLGDPAFTTATETKNE